MLCLRRLLLPGVLLLGLVAGLWLGLAHWHMVGNTGEKEDFNVFWQGAVLRHLDGTPFQPSELPKRPLLINFWATWCAPCREEMPQLDALARQRPDITVLGVAMDRAEAVHAYLKERPVGYAMVLAGEATNFDWMSRLGNPQRLLPFTVVLAEKDQPLFRHLGKVDLQALEKVIYSSSTPKK